MFWESKYCLLQYYLPSFIVVPGLVLSNLGQPYQIKL